MWVHGQAHSLHISYMSGLKKRPLVLAQKPASATLSITNPRIDYLWTELGFHIEKPMTIHLN
ncbi:hypothetical protein B7P43_G06151 [Cryptotermes secundus]|uniref:Uncharacterized protein n=1 Tax=Cryptotermes secundus TaxID=105785 RepID=A0A2J7QPU3_9NEOP|nr:hypothetical protein B7P43_G06151 [Cryptotermes secundus]